MPADHEIVVEKLAVELARRGPDSDKTLQPVIAFTVAGATWRVTLTAMPRLELAELLRQIQYALTLEKNEADLVLSDDLNIALDRKPTPD